MRRGNDPILRQIALVLLLVLCVVLLGTGGYMLLEGWDAFDALYMTFITITTVGFGEVHPLDRAGRALTIVVMLAGAGGMLYTLSTILQYALDGRLSGEIGRRRTRRLIDHLTNHVIVCGYGRVGQEVARQLQRQAVPFVILDKSDDRVALATRDGWLALAADGAKDETLLAAGIARARALITCVESDADNIYITLSARVLAPGLHIVARANDPQSESKLARVGASRVLSPHNIGGRHMALVAVRPEMVDFVDTMLQGGNNPATGVGSLQLEMLAVKAGSPFNGLSFDQARALAARGGTLLGVTRPDGQIVADSRALAAAAPLAPGDMLILIGRPEALRELEVQHAP